MEKTTPTIIFLICLVAAVVTYYPHMTYPLPFHADEWMHLSQATLMDESQHITHQWPYFKEKPNTGMNLEFGFHILVLGMNYFSGIKNASFLIDF